MIVKGANAVFNRKAADTVWDISKKKGKEVTVSVWETKILMNGVDDPVRYIKYLKKTKDRKTQKSEFSQVCIITTDMTISIWTLYKIIRARWELEKNIFRQIKTLWQMEHCFIHPSSCARGKSVFFDYGIQFDAIILFQKAKGFQSEKTAAG